jgi:threonine dehydratase
VILHGQTLTEAAAYARELAARDNLVFVHPYDDEAVIVGQGTVALELIEDVPQLDSVIVPVGGGGLAAGCAIAASGSAKRIATFGVEVESYSAMVQELTGAPVHVGGSTIAEGIAVREVGRLPLDILRRHGVRGAHRPGAGD